MAAPLRPFNGPWPRLIERSGATISPRLSDFARIAANIAKLPAVLSWR